jgi:hypothetical protein
LLKVPVALNCSVSPGTIDVAAGEITIERRADGAAGITVIEPCPATPDSAAVMVAEPVAPLLARPEVDILAMPISDELQSTKLVMFLVDPLL